MPRPCWPIVTHCPLQPLHSLAATDLEGFFIMSAPARCRSSRVAGALAVLTALTVAIVGLPGGIAYAAGETLTSQIVSQVDGAAPFTATDGAGLDSSASNDIVRTNDNVTYAVEVTSASGNADNVQIKIVLPQGMQFNAMPAVCLNAGDTPEPTPPSSLSPNPMPGPATNLTATSWQSLPVQTLVCNVGPMPMNSTKQWSLIARVRPEVPNGTVLPAADISVTSTAVTTPVTATGTKPMTVSAAPQYDLSKNSTSLTEDQGYYYQFNQPCSDRPGLCTVKVFPMLVSTPLGGKGASPLTGPVTWQDDVSPAAIYGSSVLTDPEYVAAGADAVTKYGGKLIDCRSLNYQQPNAKLTLGTALNSVRNSGTTACAQPGGTGTPISVTATATDWSAYTVPIEAPYPAPGYPLPGAAGYVYSYAIAIEYPYQVAVADLGITSGGTTSLKFKNTYTDFTGTDLAGQANLPSANPAWNDYRTFQTFLSNAGTFTKFFAGIPHASGNVPAPIFNPGSGTTEGPSASTGPESGVGQLFPGGNTISMLAESNTSTTGSPLTRVVCDAWDNTKLNLAVTNAGANGLYNQRFPSNGATVWLSGVSEGGVPSTADRITNVKVQYGTGPAGAGTATCKDADSPAGWFDSPGAVPGNDSALAAQGVYTAVTRVRVNMTIPSDRGATYAGVSVGLRAVDTLAAGTILPNWATSKTEYATSKTMAELLASTASTWTTTSYNPTDNTGNLGDRLIVASASARLVKEVWDPTTGAYSTTATPEYAGGRNVKFRLRPTLSSGTAADATKDVVVEDCLPAGENFVSSTPNGPSLIEVISGAMPGGSTITCSAGQTYLRWNLGQVAINSSIPPIEYVVKLSPTILPGTYTNTAMITAEGDLSATNLRTSSRSVQVVQPVGIALDKVALTPVIEVNRAGETTRDPLKWRLDLVNIEVKSPVPADADVIDVLPVNGVNGTSYSGNLDFVGVTVTAGSTATQPVEVLYTKATSLSSDPQASSNDPATGVTWCTAAGVKVLGAGSAADCPAIPTEVTGLRFRRPGPFPSGTVFSAEITMMPTANHAGDVYVNESAARATGLASTVGPVLSPETVVGSSIGDKVWLDANANGLQDSGEAPVGGFKVLLTGTDTDGNAVSLETLTDVNGKYVFDNLQSGTYTVTFDPASLGAEQYFTTAKVGGNRATDSNGNQTTGVTEVITLPGSFQDMTVDQGIVESKVEISKQVCLTGTGCDAGVDAQWGETATVIGGGGVEWRLLAKNTGGVPLTNVTVTDPLASSCDKTITTLGARSSQSWTCTSSNVTAKVDPNTASVSATTPKNGTITATDTATALVYTGAIASTVWYDADGDGTQDPGEAGIQNATVTVTYRGDPADPSDDRVFTVTTDAAGNYSVTGLPAGDYTVAVTSLDPDFVASADLDGIASSSTAAFSLADGDTRSDVDFGYTVPFTLGNRVWFDLNGNGQLDSGEPPVPDGTVVQLFNATTNAIVTQTTTAGGVYQFSKLGAGGYFVVIPAQPGQLAGAVAAPLGVTDPNSNADDPTDHNAQIGLKTGSITLSATLSNTANAQISGDEPTAGYTNNTLDLALLGAGAVTVTKEVCDASQGGCATTAAVGTDGWTETATQAFLTNVTWRVVVTNTGLQDLTNVVVSDPLVTGCATTVASLAVGASAPITCSTSGLLVGFTNTASVAASGVTGSTVTGTDSATIQTPPVVAGIDVTKVVISAGTPADANTVPGVYAAVGSSATFGYAVTLPSGVTVPMKDVSVIDDAGTPGTPGDDFTATYVSGDTNGNAILEIGETWLFTSPAAESVTVSAGQYRNIATALGTPLTPDSIPLADQDAASLFGVDAKLTVDKKTNGADSPTASGSGALVGDVVTWTYAVSNTGNVPMANVKPVDSDGVAISCGASDADGDGDIDLLAPGATVTCQASGSAVADQYSNTVTVNGTPSDANGAPLKDAAGVALTAPAATDTSHYYGVTSALTLSKTTNTVETTSVTGPFVTVGETVSWTYTVKNTGTTAQTNVIVTDDKVAASSISCAGGSNTIALILPGATVACVASAPATAGQYQNTGSASGTPSLPPVGTDLASPSAWPTDPTAYSALTLSSGIPAAKATATDTAFYFGIQPGASVTKAVNGVDANAIYGPYVTPGELVTFTYEVKNTGNTALTNVTVTDDKVAASAISCGTGSNTIAVVLPGATVTCTAQAPAEAGGYTNLGSVAGTPAMPMPGPGVNAADPTTWPTGATAYAPVTSTAANGTTAAVTLAPVSDSGHYFGVEAGLEVVKATNGVVADTETGPFVLVGSPVVWTYAVMNTGNTAQVNVAVTDDKVPATDIDCGEGDNVISLLLPGEIVECSAEGVATEGQYENSAIASGHAALPRADIEGIDPNEPDTWPADPEAYVLVTGTDGAPRPATVSDPATSRYFGAAPAVHLTKQVCADPTGCTVDSDAGWAEETDVANGGTATFRIAVANRGNVPLTSVVVSDPLASDCTRTFDVLDVGEASVFVCSLSNLTSPVTNVATATAQPVDAEGVSLGGVVVDDDAATVKVDGELPKTGADILPFVAVGSALAVAGLVLVLLAMRWRRRHP